MKNKFFVLIGFVFLFISLISPVQAFGIDEGDKFGAILEMVIVVIGVLGIIDFFNLSKKIKDKTTKKVLNRIRLGLVFIVLAFVWVAVAEIGEFDRLYHSELIFEILAMLGMVIIAFSPKIFKKSKEKNAKGGKNGRN